jgi:hypothetical protein
MKRIAFVMAVLMLMSCAVSAKELFYGFKAGIYTANTTEIPAGWSNTSFKDGFAGGVYIRYATSDWFSLQPEVLYVAKGFDGTSARGFSAVNYKGTFNYIEIPVLATYTVQTNGRARPYFFFGPALGINLDANVDVERTNLNTHQTATGSMDYSNVMSRTEFGIAFGAGCAVAAGPGAITLDGRFDFSLSKTFTDGVVSQNIGGSTTPFNVYAGNSKNLGFGLLVGYEF